jgi:hypothetical protein
MNQHCNGPYGGCGVGGIVIGCGVGIIDLHPLIGRLYQVFYFGVSDGVVVLPKRTFPDTIQECEQMALAMTRFRHSPSDVRDQK